eukprot:m.41784 g.41784  ORF g.41784 m.41784 type:complete len:167 (-) comp14276_c0_seq1:131-631(-)
MGLNRIVKVDTGRVRDALKVYQLAIQKNRSMSARKRIAQPLRVAVLHRAFWIALKERKASGVDGLGMLRRGPLRQHHLNQCASEGSAGNGSSGSHSPCGRMERKASAWCLQSLPSIAPDTTEQRQSELPGSDAPLAVVVLSTTQPIQPATSNNSPNVNSASLVGVW